MGKVDKVVHILSTYQICKKARKLKLYTKLSTLSTFPVCGILDLHKKKRNKCFVENDKSTFWDKKITKSIDFFIF